VSRRAWFTIALLALALIGAVALRLLVGDGTLAWAVDDATCSTCGCVAWCAGSSSGRPFRSAA
jgi:hypothetical protein